MPGYFENMICHLKKMTKQDLATLIASAQAELDLKQKKTVADTEPTNEEES